MWLVSRTKQYLMRCWTIWLSHGRLINLLKNQLSGPKDKSIKGGNNKKDRDARSLRISGRRPRGKNDRVNERNQFTEISFVLLFILYPFVPLQLYSKLVSTVKFHFPTCWLSVQSITLHLDSGLLHPPPLLREPYQERCFTHSISIQSNVVFADRIFHIICVCRNWDVAVKPSSGDPSLSSSCWFRSKTGGSSETFKCVVGRDHILNRYLMIFFELFTASVNCFPEFETYIQEKIPVRNDTFLPVYSARCSYAACLIVSDTLRRILDSRDSLLRRLFGASVLFPVLLSWRGRRSEGLRLLLRPGIATWHYDSYSSPARIPCKDLPPQLTKWSCGALPPKTPSDEHTDLPMTKHRIWTLRSWCFHLATACGILVERGTGGEGQGTRG